jgi:uncharacterized peroxidase-related enzyme
MIMPHIDTGNHYPGILSLLYFKSSSGGALSNLAQTILLGPSSMTPGERELIAAYVSKLNECRFCHDSHAAAASWHLEDDRLIHEVTTDLEKADVTERMRALLRIAAKVQKSGRAVLPEDIAWAKDAGASDEDIHDAVLVAAAFCMFNRYVDGLGTVPAAREVYPSMGRRLAQKGYRYPPRILRWLVRRILDRQFAPRV